MTSFAEIRDNTEKLLKTVEEEEEAKADKEASESDSDDDDIIGPPLPPGLGEKKKTVEKTKKSADSDEDMDESDDDDDNLVKKVPNSHEVLFNHGSKAISSLAIDPSGSRLVSGSIDYEVKFWDFAGMDASLRSFRAVKPCEAHVIRSLDFSATGDKILVIPGSSQAKVLNRDGFNAFECVKGDPYVVDVRRNKGHVGGLTSGCWHPKIKVIQFNRTT